MTNGIPECCAKKENLERHETTNPLAYIMRCKVCGRNHYHFIAPPFSMTSKLQTK